MRIRVDQGCPQCGAPVELYDTDHLLNCSYCGVRSYITANGPFRYALPIQWDREEEPLYAPFLRFKGTIYLITEKGISHKVVDTSQAGCPLPGLPPSLGVRPQAMAIRRLSPEMPGRFLRRTFKAREILEKAVNVSALTANAGRDLYHRAYIGESLSFIYLPIRRQGEELLDGVTGHHLIGRERLGEYSLKGGPFNPSWQVGFHSTLCPHCGWSLDGSGDCRVLTCDNCLHAWELEGNGLKRLTWYHMPGASDTSLYLGFWKITAHIPELDIFSFADFVQRTNQPFLAKTDWHGRVMQFLVPAFKVRPKIFLQAGRQATIVQWALQLQEPEKLRNLYPVTLPSSEARQSIKLILAAATASPRRIHPYLPRTRLKDVMTSLIYLPFEDRGHDWVQQTLGVVIGKNILRYGRSM